MIGRVASAACATAWFLSTAAPARSADADWVPILRQVLLSQQKCDLSDILSIRELPVGSAIALEGRARCLDGREFDFTRPRPHMKFDVRLCQPAVC